MILVLETTFQVLAVIAAIRLPGLLTSLEVKNSIAPSQRTAMSGGIHIRRITMPKVSHCSGSVKPKITHLPTLCIESTTEKSLKSVPFGTGPNGTDLRGVIGGLAVRKSLSMIL